MDGRQRASALATHALLTEREGGCVKIQGKLIRVTKWSGKAQHPNPARRGSVTHFTPAARLRLIRMIATINFVEVKHSLFVTLTYPDSIADRSQKQMNRDRFLFIRKLERHLGRPVCGIWRLEWQVRRSGSRKGQILPHFHLMLLGVRYVHWKNIRDWWRGVLHVDGPLATDVKGMRSGDKAARYIAKYIGKVAPVNSLDYVSYLHSSGRHYGYFRKSLIPLCDYVLITNPSPEQIAYLTDEAKECVRWTNGKRVEAFTILGNNAVRIAREFREKFLDGDAKED